MQDNFGFESENLESLPAPTVMIKDKSHYSDETSFTINSDPLDLNQKPSSIAIAVEKVNDLQPEFNSPSHVRLTWNNINVSANPSKKLFKKSSDLAKQILKSVSGYAEPGSLLAIMGSSGAGKSTLLNVLTSTNVRKLNVEGEILANRVALGPNISSISAYVQQDDLFMDELTVKKHLTFSARLRMDGKLSNGARSKRVEEVIQQMDLKKCENVRIGTPGRTKTISGGEKKRLSFAAELLNKPAILFCDETTSGLNSYQAKVVVECMRNVAGQVGLKNKKYNNVVKTPKMQDNFGFESENLESLPALTVMIKDKSHYSDETSFTINSDPLDLNQKPSSIAIAVEKVNDLQPEFNSPSHVRLTWNNINVSANPSKKLFKKSSDLAKQILKSVSGYAEPGSLLAIMGSSGAGKSTLLNVLTSTNVGKLNVEGEILVNGVALGPNISSISAYVQQDDLFMGELTVKEHLTFSARLRMDGKLSDGARSKRVEEVMQQMDLKKCENVRIGTPGRTKTISGGEKKRLSFAAELLNKPAILFCDEPTSGLDSYLAKVVVECMRNVARQGCTVLCTIHQPSSEVFELFDRLMLLALGQVVYHGDAAEALVYYERIGYPCPANYNPADHYIMVTSMRPEAEHESKNQIAEIQDHYSESIDKRQAEKKIEVINGNAKAQSELLTSLSKSIRKQQYRVGFFVQFYACLVRALKSTYRNPTLTYVKIFQQLFAAVIIGLIFLRPNFLKPYLSSDVAAVVGSLFMVIVNNTFSCAMGVMNTFPGEIPLFRRDHFNGMYSTAVYFFTKNLAEFPTYVILPLIYTIVVYFMFGLYPSASKFFIFFGLVVLMCHTCVSFGYLISCISPNVSTAIAIGPALIMPLLLLGGFFIPTKSVPDFISWIKYLSWIYYTNELLNINQWNEVDNLECPENVNGETCIYETGSDVLKSLGFSEVMFGRDIGLMFALLIGYRTLALLALYYRVRESTR